MVDILLRPDQPTQAETALNSNRARIWTMIVACVGVTVVIASMVALNTALGDIAVASKTLGPQGRQLAELSQTAFLQAMDSSLLVLGLLIAVAALVIGAWAPGRDGQQLRLVQRLSARRGPRG